MDEILLCSTVTKVLLHTPKGNHVLHTGYNYPSSTWDEERFYVVARQTGLPGNMILTFDKSFNLLHEYHFNNPGAELDAGGFHEGFYWGGKVYIANTGYNNVVEWDPASKDVGIVYQAKPIQLPPPNWDAAKDVHLNSVWCDGQNFYAVEHMGGPSRVRVFDLDWNMVKTHRNLGEQAHNIYLEDGVLYVNSSSRHAVVIRDLNTGGERWVRLAERLKWKPKFHGERFIHWAYPRGWARTKDRWFIGMSATVERGDRRKGDSCIMVLDNRWESVKEIVLNNTGGIGTGGVRLMSETDYAHNRIPCPWDGTIKGKRIL